MEHPPLVINVFVSIFVNEILCLEHHLLLFTTYKL